MGVEVCGSLFVMDEQFVPARVSASFPAAAVVHAATTAAPHSLCVSQPSLSEWGATSRQPAASIIRASLSARKLHRSSPVFWSTLVYVQPRPSSPLTSSLESRFDFLALSTPFKRLATATRTGVVVVVALEHIAARAPGTAGSIEHFG